MAVWGGLTNTYEKNIINLISVLTIWW